MVEVAGFSDITALARGGFGSVFRATRVSTGGTVALKLLDTGPDLDEVVLRRRVQREIGALVALKGHPNVVQVEEMMSTDAGPVIVMEYMDAGSVAQLVESTSPPIARIAYIGTCIASALAAAHAAGIVHRDVKPHNALMNSYGQVKLCDFGIAAIVRSAEVRTRTTSLSVRYASPEELDDAPDVGPPTDVYSLGATLHHLVRGAPPSFRERGQPDFDATIVRRSADPTRQRLDRIIDACLELDPARRPTAAEAYDLLISFGDTSGPPSRAAPTATPSAPPVVPPPVAPTGPPVDAGNAVVPEGVGVSSKGWWLATAVGLVILAAGAAWFLLGSTDEAAPTTARDASTADVGRPESTASDRTVEPTTASSAVAEISPVQSASPVPSTLPAKVPLTTLAVPTAPPTTQAPTTLVPITEAPAPPTVTAPTSAAATELMNVYLADAAARRYDAAWARLTQRYKDKYLGYDNLVRFWDTVEGAGIREATEIGSTSSTRTLSLRVWFGRLEDGTISNEVVDVDFVTGTSGVVLIDDYRYVRNDD